MIFLSGAIRIATPQELQREGEVYAQRGWELKDPTTHNVSITIDEQDIEALAEYLRQRPRDKRSRAWTDRRGIQHEARTVTLYLKGTEMAGNWVRLRATLDPEAMDPQPSSSPAVGRARPAPPVRRPAAPRSTTTPVTPAAAPQQAAPQPSMGWAAAPARPDAPPSFPSDADEELPF